MIGTKIDEPCEINLMEVDSIDAYVNVIARQNPADIQIATDGTLSAEIYGFFHDRLHAVKKLPVGVLSPERCQQFLHGEQHQRIVFNQGTPFDPGQDWPRSWKVAATLWSMTQSPEVVGLMCPCCHRPGDHAGMVYNPYNDRCGWL
jgi:hypothetical protein